MTETSERPSLARATGVMATGTALSRITGFGRIIALAYALGQNRLTDAYNVANTTPNIVYELILGGVLSATLLPVFVGRLRTADDDDEEEAALAWRDISAVATLAVAVAIAATVVFVLAAPIIIRLYLSGGTTDDQRELATTLLRLFAAQIPCYALVAITTALLHARRRFAAPMFAPIANNLIVIATLLALPHVANSFDLSLFRNDTPAVLLLGLGTTAGVVAMMVVQVLRLPAAKLRLRPVLDLRNPAVLDVARLSGWTLGLVVANQVALWVTYRIATTDPGVQSAYVTAQVFFLLPHGIVAVSLISALQPDFADDWQTRSPAELATRLVRGIRTLLAVVGPAAVGLGVLATPLLAVAVERGRFGPEDTARSAEMLVAFAAGLPAFSVFLLLARALQAMQDTRTVFYLYAGENVLNIILALLFYDGSRPWVLAGSYAAAYATAAVIGLGILRHSLGHGWASGLGAWLVRWATAVAGAAVASGAVAILLEDADDLVRLVAGGLVLVIVYMALAVGLGMREPSALIDVVRRRRST